MKITYAMITENADVDTYIRKADESLSALGFTEHSFTHVRRVSATAREILLRMGGTEREAELARIAGHLHDIGNVINRIDHAQSGALMAFRILDRMGADPEDIATIVTAIGNHDESTAFPVNPVAAALILADKTDVRHTRVRNKDRASFDIHDRVNYAVRESVFVMREAERELELSLTIDTDICAMSDYFEIFLNRMLLCKRAAEKLNARFILRINGQRMM